MLIIQRHTRESTSGNETLVVAVMNTGVTLWNKRTENNLLRDSQRTGANNVINQRPFAVQLSQVHVSRNVPNTVGPTATHKHRTSQQSSRVSRSPKQTLNEPNLLFNVGLIGWKRSPELRDFQPKSSSKDGIRRVITELVHISKGCAIPGRGKVSLWAAIGRPVVSLLRF